MTVTSSTLRRIASMSPEAMVEMLLILADQEAIEEERKAKQRERTRAYRVLRDVTEAEWCVLRELVILRDGHECRYCGGVADPPFIDHMKPVSGGGRSIVGNLAVACGPCNSSKAGRPLDEWRRR